MDPAIVGKKVKQLWPNGVAKDGRKYMDIPDAEVGAKYILVNGDKGYTAVGLQTPKSAELNATEQKKVDSNTAVNNFISNLEGHYQAAGGGGFGEGPLAGLMGNIETLKGKNGLSDQAKLYNDQRGGFSASLKDLTGDVGVLTEQDREFLMKLLPTLGDNPGVATGKFNDLRSQIAAKYGGQAGKTTINPQQPNRNPLIDMLFGASLNTANDLGAAAGFSGSNQDSEQLLKNQTDYYNLANQETDPARKQALRQRAQQSSDLIQQANNVLQSSMSKDINKGYLERSLSTGLEVGATAELPGLLSGAKALVTKPGEALANTGLRKLGVGASKVRKEAAQLFEQTGANIGDNKSTIEIAKKMLEEDLSGPISKPLLESIAKGQGIKPTEALDLLVRAGKKTFTKGGDKRLSDQSEYYELLRSGLREDFAKKVPEVIKQTSNLARGYKVKDTALSTLKYTGAAAGGIGGALYLLNLMKGKGSQGNS